MKKFKIGDIVVVLSKIYCYNYIGEVRDISGDIVFIYFPNINYLAPLLPLDIELVPQKIANIAAI